MSQTKEKKHFMPTHSFVMKEYLTKGEERLNKNVENKQMKSEYKFEKENVEVNKISKINSIMTSLKEGYKVKSGYTKSQTGIKTTVCRWLIFSRVILLIFFTLFPS